MMVRMAYQALQENKDLSVLTAHLDPLEIPAPTYVADCTLHVRTQLHCSVSEPVFIYTQGPPGPTGDFGPKGSLGEKVSLLRHIQDILN